MSLFETGIRPTIDAYIQTRAKEKRNYGQYWSASSGGYCMRLNILRRLRVPKVPEMADDELRTQRVFECGHVFHEWVQRITKNSGLSIAQEIELQDEDLLVRGHIDDLLLIDGELMLVDYKTANSQSFNYKRPEMGHYHKMQLGTYMYMLRKGSIWAEAAGISDPNQYELTEARILTISKDDLRMKEQQIFWTPQLEKDVVGYWKTLQGYWENKTLPKCTCLDNDGGFMGKRSKKGKVYNDYYYQDTPCSSLWIEQFKNDHLKGWK